MLLGFGCNKCYLERSIEARKLSKEEFIKRCKEIHLNDYNYNLVKFNKNTDKVQIYCCNCKKYFFQTIASHLSGSGCPFCKESRGEKEIRYILEKKKINFIQHKTFDNLKDASNLNYDFYLPDYNLLIEYNGIQHYKFNKYFYKSLHSFHKQKHHDWLKRKYSKDNKINLLVISYKENISNKIKDFIIR